MNRIPIPAPVSDEILTLRVAGKGGESGLLFARKMLKLSAPGELGVVLGRPALRKQGKGVCS